MIETVTITPMPGEPTRFWVPSITRPEHPPHLVDLAYLDPDTGKTGAACSCEHFMVRGIQCKHILAVLNYVRQCAKA